MRGHFQAKSSLKLAQSKSKGVGHHPDVVFTPIPFICVYLLV